MKKILLIIALLGLFACTNPNDNNDLDSPIIDLNIKSISIEFQNIKAYYQIKNYPNSITDVCNYSFDMNNIVQNYVKKKTDREYFYEYEKHSPMSYGSKSERMILLIKLSPTKKSIDSLLIINSSSSYYGSPGSNSSSSSLDKIELNNLQFTSKINNEMIFEINSKQIDSKINYQMDSESSSSHLGQSSSSYSRIRTPFIISQT